MQGALLSSIEQGARLKKVAQVNDRSAPLVGNVSDGPPIRPGGAPPVPGGAPPVPGMNTRPQTGGLAPPVPPGSRGRSNSDGGDGASSSGPPQLAGILAGGMPKLRKVGGNVNTGADNHAPYLSEPETVMRAPPVPPGSAPPPPTVAQLRSNLRPSSVASFRGIANKPKPAPPVGKKPPIPPPSSRKPSGSHPPSLPASAPRVPPSTAPRPPERSTPAPPPVPNGSHLPSLAQQAARNAFNRSAAAPPPPEARPGRRLRPVQLQRAADATPASPRGAAGATARLRAPAPPALIRPAPAPAVAAPVDGLFLAPAPAAATHRASPPRGGARPPPHEARRRRRRRDAARARPRGGQPVDRDADLQRQPVQQHDGVDDAHELVVPRGCPGGGGARAGAGQQVAVPGRGALPGPQAVWGRD